MKRILLMTPPKPVYSPFSLLEKRPPLGLGFLIAILRKEGHQVYFIDNYIKPSFFKMFLIEKQIDYVGIYLDSICFLEGCKVIGEIDKMSKDKEWNGKIIAGGPHVSVAPNTIPESVDYLVQGEGEMSLLEILNGNTGRVVRSERIKDLDALPRCAWDYFEGLPYDDSVEWFHDRPVFTMNTSRGCPFDCTFCSVCSIWGKRYTCFSAKRIIDDIEYLIGRYKAKAIFFREDNFTFDRKRVVEFCELLLRKDIKIKWVTETRIDALDYDLMHLMHRAGCRAFYLGVESGNQRLLDFIKKGITLEQIEKAFSSCHRLGIKTAASFIVGLPTETEEERMETLSFAKKIKPSSVWFNVFVGIPRSELYDYVLKSQLYEYIDSRGLLYLKGHNQLVDQFYGEDSSRKIPPKKFVANKKHFISYGDKRLPKVSVIISAYNAQKYLKEALDSILNQTFSEFELIIINDGSTDKTGVMLREVTDKRVTVFNNLSNIGLTKSLNNGLKLARGEYIARMDLDDISLPQRLQLQVEFLENHPSFGLVGTAVVQIDEMGKEIAKINLFTESEQIKKELMLGNQFYHGSIMFRRTCLEKVGLYREEFKYAQDYDLYLRIAEYFDLANLPDFLYKWRLIDNSISIEKKSQQDKYAALARECAKRRRKGRDDLVILHSLSIKDKNGSKIREKRLALAYHYYHLGRSFCGQNRMREARLMLNKALRLSPLYPEVVVFYLATYLPISWLRKIRSLWLKIFNP
ncbi:MAG: glycosyltransferase [Candidatus Omnitrophota bacterium]